MKRLLIADTTQEERDVNNPHARCGGACPPGGFPRQSSLDE